MQRFSNIRKAYKLLIGFGSGLLLIALGNVLVVIRLAQLNAISAQLARDPLPGTAAISVLSGDIRQYRILELLKVLSDESVDHQLLQQERAVR